jgi:formamidopyrimidine-DNA glycosylase
MPELPEVETTVKDLREKILGRKIEDVWTDFQKMIKKPKDFKGFKKEIKRKKIKNIRRRGKNILIDLSGSKTLLIHQKLTGHLLLGRWRLEKGGWTPIPLPPSRSRKERAPAKKIQWKALIPGPLMEDPMNRFLHLIFWLDDGRMLALSDLRKFAKAELWDSDKLNQSEGIKSLGPEPLDKSFTFEKFQEIFKNKRGKIKQILMNQQVLAGIGNIYSDETLWEAKVHPFKDVSKLSKEELKKIYQAMKKILRKAVEVKGESISDFRRISGEKGGFDPLRKVYRKEGEKCSRCGTIIKKIKLAGRSAHFCPTCQKL